MNLEKYVNSNKSQLKIDWLTIRVRRDKINKQVWGLVDNSNETYFDNGFLKLRLDTYNNKFSFYGLYDINLNLIGQLCITTPLNNDSKLYNKLVLYGTFFNFFYEDFYSDIFEFFGIDLNSPITRFDIKLDIPNLPISKIPFKTQKIAKNVETSGLITWRTKEVSSRYKFRVYDKKLQIIGDNLQIKKSVYGNYPYQEILDSNKLNPLTRLEMQLNSKYIKVNKFTLSVIFNQEILYKIFNNLLNENLIGYGKKIRISKEDLIKSNSISEFAFNQKVNISYTRSLAYLKKLYLLEPLKFKKRLFDILSSVYPENEALNVMDDFDTGFKPLGVNL